MIDRNCRNWKYILICTFLSCFSYWAHAQQKLNLGFDELSAEGINRPWGWSVRIWR